MSELQRLARIIAGLARFEGDHALEALAGELAALARAQSVAILEPSTSHPGCRLRVTTAHTPFQEYVHQLELREDEGIFALVLESDKTVVDSQADSWHSFLAFEESAILAPIYHGEERMGWLYLGASKPNSFGVRERHLAEAAAQQLALLLKNKALTNQVELLHCWVDGLTGFYTHRVFHHKLEAEVEWSQKHRRPFCLAMVSTDSFKTYNDTLGHAAGDALLKEIAALLRDKAPSTTVTSRFSGDEFTLLFRETTKEVAAKICERIREAYQLRFGGNQVQVTASIGLACFPSDATNKKDLVKAVDDALYVAKRGGRNCVALAPTLESRDDDDDKPEGGNGVPAWLPTLPNGPLSAGEARELPEQPSEGD